MVVNDELRLALKRERIRQGFSLRQLAEKADLNHTVIWNIERGLRDPQFVVLCQILRALHMELTIETTCLDFDRLGADHELDNTADFGEDCDF